MTTSTRRPLLAVLGSVAAVAVVAGCASTDTTASNQPTAAAPSPAAPAEAGLGGVSPAVAQKLCDSLSSQLQSMRTYTLTPGKITLNGVVGTWAAQNGVDLVDLATHKSRIDTITQAQCPDVRTEVTKALEIPNLASGLLGI